jgi:hypothetical protein
MKSNFIYLKVLFLTSLIVTTNIVTADPLVTAIEGFMTQMASLSQGMMIFVGGASLIMGLYRFILNQSHGGSGAGIPMIIMSFVILIFGFSLDSFLPPEYVEESTSENNWIWPTSIGLIIAVISALIFKFKDAEFWDEVEIDDDEFVSREQQSYDILKRIKKRTPSISSLWREKIIELHKQAHDLITHSSGADDATKSNNLVAVRMLDKLSNTLKINNGQLPLEDETLIQNSIDKLRTTFVDHNNKISNRRLKKMRIELEVIDKNLSLN